MHTRIDTMKRTLAICAVSATAVGAAGATFLLGAGSALAPGPSQNGSTYLASGIGNKVTGTWVNTGRPVKIVSWPGTPSSVQPKPPVGMPCVTTSLGTYQRTTGHIYDDGAGPYCWYD